MTDKMNIKSCTQEFWDAFVDASPQGTVFNKSFFLNSYALPVKYLICWKGQQAVAGFGFVESDSGIKLMPYCPSAGIIFKDLREQTTYRRNETIFQVLETFAHYLFAQYQEVDFANHWDILDMRPFDWVNYHERQKGYYQVFPRYTSLVDISNPMDTAEYSSKRRIPELKKGIKEGHNFVTREITDIDLLDRLVGMNYARQGLDRSEEAVRFLKNICATLFTNKAGILQATFVDSEPAVLAYFAHDKHRAYYLFAGTDLNRRDLGAGTKNFYEASIYLNQKFALKEIDMVGVNSPLRASYKLSYGGNLKLYFRVKKVLPMNV
jgi:hypothetical protein